MNRRVGPRAVAPVEASVPRWYRSRTFWALFFRRYLPFAALANLAWEIAQIPLYTIWHNGSPGEIVFAVLHCTGGDVLIASASLLLAAALAGARRFPDERVAPVTVLAVVLGFGYTLYSEWMNAGVLGLWAYAPAMPRIPILGTGLAPALQWLVVPSSALWFAFRRARHSTRKR